MTLSHEQLEELLGLLHKTEDHEIDCETVLDRAARFVEAVTGPNVNLDDQLRDVAQHLRVCPECREEIDAIIRGLRPE